MADQFPVLESRQEQQERKLRDTRRVLQMFFQLGNGEVPQVAAQVGVPAPVSDFWQFLLNSMAKSENGMDESTRVSHWREVARRWRACGSPLFSALDPIRQQTVHDAWVTSNEERCASAWVSRNAHLLPLVFATEEAVEECTCKLYASATRCTPPSYYNPAANAASIGALLRHAPEAMQVKHSFFMGGCMRLGTFLLIETAAELAVIENRCRRRESQGRQRGEVAVDSDADADAEEEEEEEEESEESKEACRQDEAEEAAMEFTDPAARALAEGTLDLLLDLPQDASADFFTDVERHLRDLHCCQSEDVMSILQQVRDRRAAWAAAWAGRGFWVQACILVGLQEAAEEAFKRSRTDA